MREPGEPPKTNNTHLIMTEEQIKRFTYGFAVEIGNFLKIFLFIIFERVLNKSKLWKLQSVLSSISHRESGFFRSRNILLKSKENLNSSLPLDSYF